LDAIQQAILDHHALQCGFCTPGIVMSAKALLDSNPNPTTEEIKEALAGNLCRCTGYQQVIDAVADAAERRAGKEQA
jgi:carbon-monoxide dehydrogenase small subunit